MAVRQYIGARYVPLYAGDWDATKNYEPLTIVTDANGNSFTSLKDVPAGTPLADRGYWIQTSSFSAAVDALQRRMNDAENDIVNINDELSHINDRHFLLVSDSYGDPGAIEGGRTWIDMFEDIVGASNISKAYRGGFGFSPAYDTNNSFLRLITPGNIGTGLPAGYDTTKPTDIIVAGGFNDRAQTVENIESAISQFCTYARQTFPNLKRIYIAAVGASMNPEFITELNNYRYIRGYASCGKYGAIFIEGSQFILHQFDRFGADANPAVALGNQYVHPNAYGSQCLAAAFYSAVNGGGVCVKTDWKLFQFDLAQGISIQGATQLNMAQSQSGQFVRFTLPQLNISGNFTFDGISTDIDIATITSGGINWNGARLFYVPGFIAGGSQTGNNFVHLALVFKEGKVCARVFGATGTAKNVFIFAFDGMSEVLAG